MANMYGLHKMQRPDVEQYRRQLLRDAGEMLDRLTSARTLLTELLLAEVVERLGDEATDEQLDNLDSGLDRLLGPRGGPLYHASVAREWLDSALREVAMDFADEFAEDVLRAADKICREAEARRVSAETAADASR